jgi:tetratricopeptide (TPR) repeat protein
MSVTVIVAALMCAAVCSCGAYTLEDFQSAQKLLGKSETRQSGMDQLTLMCQDTGFSTGHPEEFGAACLIVGRDKGEKHLVDAALLMEKGLAVAPKGGGAANGLMGDLTHLYLDMPDGPQKSIALCGRLITEYPKGDVSLWKLRMAQAQRMLGLYDDAIATCNAILKDTPESSNAPEALAEVAMCRDKQGNYVEEVAAYRKIETQYPKYLHVAKSRATADAITLLYLPQSDQDALLKDHREEAIKALGDYGNELAHGPAIDTGLAALAKAIDLGPTDKKVLADLEYVLGSWYRASGRNEQAVQAGEKLLHDFPDRAFDAKMLIGYGYQCMKQYDKAIPVLEDVVKNIDPKHCGANFNLATCYNMAGKYDEAIALYDKVAANGECPGVGSECLIEKAIMLVSKMNKLDDAIAAYKQAFVVADAPGPEDTAAFLNALEAAKPGKSGADLILSRMGDAISDMRTRTETTLAQVLMDELRKYSEARALYLQLAAENASSELAFEFKLKAATCDQMAENWVAARDGFKSLCDSMPPSARQAEVKFLMVGCLVSLGDYAGARKALEEIRSAVPDTDRAASAQKYLATLPANSGNGGEVK